MTASPLSRLAAGTFASALALAAHAATVRVLVTGSDGQPAPGMRSIPVSLRPGG